MPRIGAITQQDQDFVETWENISPQQNAIVRLDARGDEKAEVIQGRRQFMLTTEDRIVTSSKVLDPKNDPFKNGAFRPIVVPDDVTEQSNPNALGDDEIKKIFGSSDVAWEEWLKSIDAVATLRRMIDLAEEADDLTMKRYRQLAERLVEVRGTDRVQVTTKDETLANFLREGPSTQKQAEGRVKRGMGGRSSDYR